MTFDEFEELFDKIMQGDRHPADYQYYELESGVVLFDGYISFDEIVDIAELIKKYRRPVAPQEAK